MLADAPRPGCPGKFTAEQHAQIIAVACEPPAKSDRPIDHWTARELADEVVKRKAESAASTSGPSTEKLPRGSSTSIMGGQYEVDPIKDLRPVCPNCHAVLHRRIPAYRIEEVRAFLDRAEA